MFNNFFTGKKVLVTGHTGFKGSWLSIWLKELGAEVYGYSLPPLSQEDNFEACGLVNSVVHKVGDVRNAEVLMNFFKEVQPDIAFHLAAQPLVLRSYEFPSETFSTNLMGVVNFFEAVRATDSVKVAINVTSDKCYENNEWVWGYRESDAMGGSDPYSASKGCAELITTSYTRSFFKTSHCSVASARAGNVIGGGDWAENRIVPDLFRAVKSGQVLSIRNPESVRPWQHVLEPLSGYLALASSLAKDQSLIGAWNFGPSAQSIHSVKDLVESMSNYVVGIKCNFDYPAQRHEAKLLSLDTSKAAKELQWRSVLSFDETVQYTVRGYVDQFSDGDLLSSRRHQIKDFCKKAQLANLPWANK